MARYREPGTWSKVIMGVVVGVLSGGIVMYVSPVVDKAIKPPKPTANFSIQIHGLQVTFHNQSVGGDGFWDFGDGSALVPTTKQTEIMTHTYSEMGQYTAKLTIHNFIGDENERTVPIDLRNQIAVQPKILSLQASPVSQSTIAPATFRITSDANNVQTCVWDFGSDKPLDISSESPNHQERLVTFDKPGKYWVQLAALNGKQSDRKFVPIDVKAAPPDSLMAVLSVVDQGVRLESRIETVRIALADDGTAQPFAKSIPVTQGFVVRDLRLAGAPPAGVRNISILPSPDGTRVSVSGEIQPTSRGGGSRMIVVLVEMRIERQVREYQPVARSTVALTVPGATTLTLACCPPEWIRSNRAMLLELYDGSKYLESHTIPCPETKIGWKGQEHTIRAAFTTDQVAITVK